MMPPHPGTNALNALHHEQVQHAHQLPVAGALQEHSLNFKNICVIGLGYIGLPTASTLAAKGISVIGVDVNERVLATLRSNEIHIHEQGLREMYRAAVDSGRLTIASRPAEADAFIIAVPTPFHEDRFGDHDGRNFRLADLSAVVAATESVVPVLRKGNLVVLESTSPPRTTIDIVAPILARSGLQPGIDIHLCYSPERVLPGQILRELKENPRVVGGITPESARRAAELYHLFVEGEIIETDATTAEMVKLMENTYRDINIAIANEFSRLADRFGVDVWEAISLANRHPRVKILNPGPGVGGHCISVDPWFLVEGAPQLTPLIAAARRVNDSQPEFVVDAVRRALGELKDKRVAALGLAYKPNVDDVRESPAVEVVRLLRHEGVRVLAWEPFKPGAPLPGIEIADDLDAAIVGADAILLLVAHSQLASLDPVQVAAKTSARLAIDTVNAWKPEAWQEAGFRYIRLGTPAR
jgi:UDP-N-acetyl-D-mannosaminuronic acid dehydrogenase